MLKIIITSKINKKLSGAWYLLDDNMTDLTKEIFDTLPELVQANYELSGDVYVTKDSLKVGALKDSLNKVYTERDGLRSQMTEAEQKKADEIAQAKEDALKEALEKNNSEEATRLLQEKLADAERRAGETESKFKERLNAIAKEKESVVISGMSQLARTGAERALSRLLKDYIKVDADTGETTFLNDDGSASSLNKEQFIKSLNDNDLFKPLLKAELPTHGGGQSNGSLGLGGAGERPKPKSQKTNGYLATIK